jgi:hypothetical protein
MPKESNYVFPHPHDAVRIPFDLSRIRKLSSFCPSDKQDVAEIQSYLRHFGYMPHSTTASTTSVGEETETALKAFQEFFGLTVDGTFGPETRTAMSNARCGLPDLVQSVDFSVAGPWKYKKLRYCFGTMPSHLDANTAKDSVRRAMKTWANAKVGLTFTEVNANQDPDIFIEWRPASDSDHSMVGSVLAHADFPPGFSVIVNRLPLPLHYDDTEHKWVDGAKADSFDVETISLHELGHILGLYHSSIQGSIMYPTMSPNSLNRGLTEDDRNAIRNLYPVWQNLGGQYHGKCISNSPRHLFALIQNCS